jgi:uncharacterized membrane protein
MKKIGLILVFIGILLVFINELTKNYQVKFNLDYLLTFGDLFIVFGISLFTIRHFMKLKKN